MSVNTIEIGAGTTSLSPSFRASESLKMCQAAEELVGARRSTSSELLADQRCQTADSDSKKEEALRKQPPAARTNEHNDRKTLQTAS